MTCHIPLVLLLHTAAVSKDLGGKAQVWGEAIALPLPQRKTAPEINMSALKTRLDIDCPLKTHPDNLFHNILRQYYKRSLIGTSDIAYSIMAAHSASVLKEPFI